MVAGAGDEIEGLLVAQRLQVDVVESHQGVAGAEAQRRRRTPGRHLSASPSTMISTMKSFVVNKKK